jgi:hypothetical protein
MADEIEQINASTFFAPSKYMCAKKPEVEYWEQYFYKLPKVMRFYALGLRRHLRNVPEWTAQVIPPSSHGHSPALLGLSVVVSVFTGKWHDRETTDLLNAAALALGEKFHMSELDLTQARSRRKKKNLKVFYGS